MRTSASVSLASTGQWHDSLCSVCIVIVSTARSLTDSNADLAGDPYVEVVYSNAVTERIDTKDLTVQRIMDTIGSKTQEMEAHQRLQAAGIGGQQLRSTFGGAGNVEGLETGRTSRIPPI